MKKRLILLFILSFEILSQEANTKYSVTKENFSGLTNSWRVKIGNLELVIPTEIGPRILHFSKIGEPNLFRVLNDQLENKNIPNWQNYGGHRLWRAPEDKFLTYSPENSEVNIADNKDYILISKLDTINSLLKEMEIHPDSENSIRVVHRLTNKSKQNTKVSAWALTVFPLEGRSILPLTNRGSHPENLLATDSIHLWAYTDMGDQLFIKKFYITPTRSYPDKNSRVEVFINKKFLELETLSPLVRLKENEFITHTEMWYLYTLPKNITSNKEIVKYIGENLEMR